LRLRRCDRDKLLFRIAGRFFIPLALNCGLSPAPWLCIKILRPVVQKIRRQVHRIISYLGDISGAPQIDCVDTPASQADAKGGLGNSKSLCETGPETTPCQDRQFGEARPGAAWDCGRHSSGALQPVPRETSQDLISGPTLPPDLHSAQTEMLPPRRSAILWSGKLRESRGHRRSPLLSGPLKLCRRRHLNSVRTR
jgi:hypothetical protein